MVDFGFATTYINEETGEHLPPTKTHLFRGNLFFSSLNQLKFYKTSRKDDIHSLFFLTVFLLNGGRIPNFNWKQIRNLSKEQRHILIKNAKDQDSLTFWCHGPSK